MGPGVVLGSKKTAQRRPKRAKGLPKGSKKTRKRHSKGFHKASKCNKQVHWKFYRQFKKQCYCQCNRQCNRQPQAPTHVDVNKIQLDVATIVWCCLLPYKSVQSRLQVPWRISCTRPKRRHEDGCNMKTVCVCVCVCVRRSLRRRLKQHVCLQTSPQSTPATPTATVYMWGVPKKGTVAGRP